MQELLDSNFTQSSTLSPQSLEPKALNFAQICIDLLRSRNLVRFRAPGFSMYPTILNGDEVTVEPINPEAVKVGDIVLYRGENGVIAHRVVRIENKNVASSQSSVLSPQSCFTLRGDARPTCDEPVAAGQILGKVVSVERNGRCISPYGLRVNLHYKARHLASRIKKLLIRPNSTPA